MTGPSLRDEVEPILAHGAAMLCLLGCLLGIGLVALLLGHLVPQHAHYVELIEVLDIWFTLAAVSLFGLYTLARLGIRLTKGIRQELDRA